ncbi:MAG: hypothetical protein HY720_33135 [Planctomycetes bacterium]|nr:hypothetical protein [Planctomycetota bacterium]
MFRRAWVFLLLVANLAALFLYLYDRFPRAHEWVGRSPAVAREVDRALAWMRERRLHSIYAIPAAVAVVYLSIGLSWLAGRGKKRKKKERPRPARRSWASRLPLLVVFSLVAAAAGLYLYIVLYPEDLVPFGDKVIRRGSRVEFLEFSGHVLLLVLSAHILLLLTVALFFRGGRKPAAPQAAKA